MAGDGFPSCHGKRRKIYGFWGFSGGDGGIRTLDRALQPYNGLANRRLQPLGHISWRIARCDICPTPPPFASARGRRWRGFNRDSQGQGRWRNINGANKALVETMAASALRRGSQCVIVRQTVRPRTKVRLPISNATHEQADQARQHRRQPRLISRYVGTRKPFRRRATCLTILGSALASPSCA